MPVAVILSLPIAGLGAYVGNWLCGLENNIYFQIGLVMLVGLVAKNAILIVEFAKEEVDRGGDLVQSALHAARLRFRPGLRFGARIGEPPGNRYGCLLRYAGGDLRGYRLRPLLLRVGLPHQG